MKKRIACLMMALVMLVLALPLVALPVTAAETVGFTTTMDTENNWPEYNDKVSFGRYVGNWELGTLTPDEYFTDYRFDATASVISGPAGAWGGTGFYLAMNRVILRHEGFYATKKDDGTSLPVQSRNHNAAVKAYRAAYTGTVTLDLDSFEACDAEPADAGQDKEVYFAIFVNGKMVFPMKDKATTHYFTEPNRWLSLSDTEDYFEAKSTFAADGIVVDVSRGDIIQFAVAKKEGCTKYASFVPTVTYDDGYTLVAESIEDAFTTSSENWPAYVAMNGTYDFKQTDENWSLGSVNRTTGAFTPYAKNTCVGSESYAHLPAEGGDTTPWDTNGGFYMWSVVSDLRGTYYFGESAVNTPAIAGTAAATTEKLTPSFIQLLLLKESGDIANNASATLQIRVNGNVEQSITVNSDADGAVTLADPVAPLSVVRGDSISFTFANPSTGVIGARLYPKLKYEELESFISSKDVETLDIAVEKVSLEIGHNMSVKVEAFATIPLYDAASKVVAYFWEEAAAQKVPGTAKYSEEVTADMAYAYVAEYTGFAAKEMGDKVYYQVIAYGADNAVIAQTEIGYVVPAEIAAAKYATTLDAEKAVYAKMLNYGAYAQTYFNYKTDALVNATLDNADKALNTEKTYYADFAAEKKTTLLCDSEVSDIALIAGNNLALRVYVGRWQTESGAKIYLQYADNEIEANQAQTTKQQLDGADSYIIDDIGLDELSKIYYMRVAVADQSSGRTIYRYGYSVSYSVESYVARMIDSTTPNLAEMLRAMMEFGNAINFLANAE